MSQLPGSNPFQRPKVVFATNEPELNKLLMEYFQILGMESEAFVDSKAFLMAVKKSHPDICIVDLHLGREGSGPLIIKAIRNVFGPGIPLFMIARPDDSLLKMAIEAGANGFFGKPLTKGILAEKLAPFVKTPEMTKALAEEGCRESTTKNDPTHYLEKLEGYKEFKIPKGVDHFFEKVVLIYSEIKDYIEDFTSSEEKVNFYLQVFKEYEEIFVKFVNSLGTREEKLTFEQCVRLYGMRNLKFLIVAIKISELTQEQGFKWDKDNGRPKVAPEAMLRYADRTLKQVGDESRFRHVAFISGLAFDLLAIMNKKNGENVPKIEKMLEHIHAYALRLWTKAFEAAKKTSEFKAEKFLLSTLFYRYLGRVLMAMYEPKYIEFLETLKRTSVPDALARMFERKQFGYSYPTLSAMYVMTSPDIYGGYKSVQYYDENTFLSLDSDQTHFNLTQMCKDATATMPPIEF